MKRIVLLALVTAACGGTSGTAIDRNRAGTGSSTLLVSATVAVTNSATSPTTSLTADVSDGLGAAVTGATVTIQNAGLGGDTALVETPGGTAGHYTASQTGLHAINSPALNSTAPANQPLDVSWTTPAISKSATITTRNYSVTVPDTGTYTIPAANNPARAGQRVIVKRANEVEIARGLPGSILRATVTTTVDPFTVQ